MRSILVLCLLAFLSPLLPAAAAPGYQEKMREGKQAAQQYEWEKAVAAYRMAEDIAAKGERQAEAALQRALAIRKWFSEDPSLASQPKRRDEVIACYRVVIRSGSRQKVELACNNLGVLYARMKKYNESVRTFRQVGPPMNPDAHAFYFNFGRALELAGSPDGAYEQYWLALKKRPTFAAAAKQACEVLRTRKGPGRNPEAAGLFAFLLTPPSPHLPLLGEQIPRFLVEGGEGADALLHPLLDYYEAAQVDPQKFKAEELPRLDKVRPPGFPGKVEDLRRAYLPEGFEQRWRERSKVLFDSRQEVLAFFPAWGPLLAEEEGLARGFARLLKGAGDAYYHKSLSREEKDVAREEDARQALARYSASLLLDRGNLGAAVGAASTLAAHLGRIDPGSKLLAALIGQLSGKDRGLEAGARTKPDWVNVYSCHVILGDLFERQKKWGAEDNPEGAIYHWLKAREAERRIRQEFDPNYPQLHSLGARLGRAYWNAGKQKRAVESYLASADQFALYGNSRGALNTLEEVRKQVGVAEASLNGEQKDRLETLAVVARNLGEVKVRADIPGRRDLLALGFTADGKSLVAGVREVGGWGGTHVEAWDAGTGKPGERDPWWGGGVSVMAFAPDGKRYACGQGAGVLLCTLGNRTAVHLSPQQKGLVRAVAFSGDSKWLASSDSRDTVTVWDLEKQKQQKDLAGPGEVSCLALSLDGKLLAFGSGTAVTLWNVATGKELAVLKGHTERVNALSFSPDGKRLASGGTDRRIKLWAVGSGKELASLGDHHSEVRAVQFSADGKVLLSADEEGSVRLRDPETGQEKVRLPLPRGGLTAVTLGRDGKTLATGSGPATQWGQQTSGQLRLWDLGKIGSSGLPR